MSSLPWCSAGHSCNSVKQILLLVFAVSTCLIGFAQPGEPSVTFKIKNFGVNVEGSFKGLGGAIQFDSNAPETSHFDVVIDASSVDTGIELRNKHLRKEDYFDAKNFPKILFSSTSIEATPQPDRFTVTGKLTIKKTTKEIKFDFNAVKKENGFLLKGVLTINRRDYGVGSGSLSMGDDVRVFLAVNSSQVKKL